MKNLLFVLLTLTSISAYPQKVTYVVFEDRALFADMDAAPFKLRFTDVKLQNKINAKKTLHIYNLYYSRNNFTPVGTDKKSFVKGSIDYREFYNDVLVTLTPLTDSLDQKLVKLTGKQLTNSEYIMPERLLQGTITNLYKEFTKNDIANFDKEAGQLKTMQYKLLIKRGKDYYAFNGPVLTEFYIVNYASYLFPDQYHYAEINTVPSHKVPYFGRKAIADLNRKFTSITQDNDYTRDQLYGRVYPSHADSVSSLYYTEYNTHQKRFGSISFAWQKDKIYDGAEGIGTFDFAVGTGIINGSFDFYFKNYKSALEAENDTQNDIGTMRYQPVSINRLSIKDYVKAYQQKYPPKIIVEM